MNHPSHYQVAACLATIPCALGRMVFTTRADSRLCISLVANTSGGLFTRHSCESLKDECDVCDVWGSKWLGGIDFGLPIDPVRKSCNSAGFELKGATVGLELLVRTQPNPTAQAVQLQGSWTHSINRRLLLQQTKATGETVETSEKTKTEGI